MSRSRNRRAAFERKRAHIDLPPEEEHDDPEDQHDGWGPIRERDTLPMREGPPLDLRAPWPLPTANGR